MRIAVGGVLVFAAVASFGGLLSGPALGDHEAIVAVCARNMRLSGNWLVPYFLDTPFIRKPPLPYWAVAASSYLFPVDPQSGLPVTTAAARFPSALAAFATILIIWRLGTAMFNRQVGLIAGAVAASSLGVLLYGANATAEMLLTFACTWAFAHFWFAVRAPTPGWRTLHALLFYGAWGVAMLAKGPAPLGLVGVPLLLWWYTHRPLRIIARRGHAVRWPTAALCFFRDLGPRTVQAFTKLWVIPGLLLFLLIFVPWMIGVYKSHPFAWDMWNWQYVERVEGDFGDSGDRGPLYYLPIIGGFIFPWTVLVIEAAAAPWLTRYARFQRPLLYAGLWVLLGLVFMSLMEFKKPYYILPAVPGLILLLAPVIHHYVEYAPRRGAGTALLRAGVAITLVGVTGAAWLGYRGGEVPVTPALAGVAGIVLTLLVCALVAFRLNHRRLSFATAAAVTVASFHLVWNHFDTTIDNIDRVAALDATLDAHQVPPNVPVFWADRRPDARLTFYFLRRSEHLIEPVEVVTRATREGRVPPHFLQQLAVQRAASLLNDDDPVYLVVERDNLKRWRHRIEPAASVLPPTGVDRPTRHDWIVVTNRRHPA